MKKTVGNTDKLIRILLAVAIVVLIFVIPLTGVWVWVAAAVALIALITALSGYCGLYSLLGISTCKVNPEAKKDETG